MPKTTDAMALSISVGTNRLDYRISSRQINCSFCNIPLTISTVHPGEQIKCPRCHHTILRIEVYPFLIPLVYSLLSLLAFVLCLYFPLLSVKLPYFEQVSSIHLWQMFKFLLSNNNFFLAFVFLLFVIVLPLIFVFTVLYVFSGIYYQKKWPGIAHIAEIMFNLRPWLMIDIFLISILVAIVKINALANFQWGQAATVLFGYSIFLARLSLTISEYWVREKVANLSHFPIHYGVESYFQIREKMRIKVHLAWALLVASLIFYFPANLFPMMMTEGIGYLPHHSTILEGIVILWRSQDYVVASVIFIASFLIPLIKIFILLILLLAIDYKSWLSSSSLTWCYIAVERIGRWSMIDVFVIMLLVSLFHSRAVFISAGPAVFYFSLVVNLAMIATGSLDTRLLWSEESQKIE